MKIFILLLCSLLAVFAQNATNFRARFRQTDPSGIIYQGIFAGRIDYLWVPSGLAGAGGGANSKIRRDYNVINPSGSLSGPVELLDFGADKRFLYCSTCEVTSYTTPAPRYWRHGSDSASGGSFTHTDGRTCQCYTPTDGSASAVSLLCVDNTGSALPCRAVHTDGQVFTFTNITGFADQTTGGLNGTSLWSCPPPTCQSFLDVEFVVDESGSISSSEWNQQMNFVVSLINSFSFGTAGGQPITTAGLVYFDTDGREVSALTTSKVSLTTAINSTSQGGGYTCHSCGMWIAINAFTSLSTARRNLATQLIILLTDGDCNVNCAQLPNVTTSTLTNGILVISIGIGITNGSSGYNTIVALSSNPATVGFQTVYLPTDFSVLQNLLPTIVGISCIPPSNGNPCPGCLGFCSCGLTCLCPDICDDGSLCTNDFCTSGQNGNGCQYPNRTCNDGNACTSDTCSPATGCIYTNITCNDGSVCTTDTCSPGSGCQYLPITCNDGDSCTNDTCNSGSGCVYTNINVSNCLCQGVVCSTSYVCATDTCNLATGLCGPVPRVCNDNNLCTSDACNQISDSCVYTPITCNDGNACTSDTCNPQTGCVYTPFAPDACDDSSNCTYDYCVESTGCVNEQVSCDDEDVCTTDTCNSLLGCSNDIRDCGSEPAIAELLGQTNNGKTPCFVAGCNSSLTNGCRVYVLPNSTVDDCGVCNGDGSTCGSGLNTTDVAAIGGGVIAALVLGLVALIALICLAAGKTGYDVYLRGKGALSGANTNPLYDNEGMSGTNVFYMADQ